MVAREWVEIINTIIHPSSFTERTEKKEKTSFEMAKVKI